MRLKKRGSIDAAAKRNTRPASSGLLDEEKSLIGSMRAPAPPLREEPSAAQTPREEESRIIRRQEYAPTYQIGRRYSSPEQRKPAEKIASSGAPWLAGASVAVSPAKPRGRKPVLIAVAVASAAVLTAAVVFGAMSLMQKPAPAHGEEVFFGGRMLCIASDRDAVEKDYVKILADLKGTYGMDVQQDDKLTFSPVSCDSRNILSDAGIADALKANMDVKVLASVILVNDRPAVALRSPQEAQQALDSILAPFRNAPAQLYRADIGFVENVQISQMPTDYSLVQPLDQAIHILMLGTNVDDNLYTVKKGDSLGKIAKIFKLKISDLRTANPQLAISDVIQPGQTLNAVKPANWVSVRYTDTVTREETLPYDTVEQTSSSMYTTQKEIKQEGKNGQREVVAKVMYINGMEAQQDILSQTVLQAAQSQIVMKGTKKVPTNSVSGGSSGGSSSGGYIKPLKSYTLTSTFRVRTLNGVTRWHYGDDLAAPTGTPIYAAKAGTVTYSGSASGYGQLIKIDVGGGVENRYGHMSRILVKKGQNIKQGQIIGLVGATGDATGPHLHFEVRVNGKPVDPMKYIRLEADIEDWAYLENKSFYSEM